MVVSQRPRSWHHRLIREKLPPPARTTGDSGPGQGYTQIKVYPGAKHTDTRVSGMLHGAVAQETYIQHHELAVTMTTDLQGKELRRSYAAVLGFAPSCTAI